MASPTRAEKRKSTSDPIKNVRFSPEVKEIKVREIDEDDEEKKVDEYEDDDEDEQTIWTFRAMFLGSVASIFLLVLNKYFLYQSAQCILTIVSVLVMLYPIGLSMAKFLPRRRVYLPSIGLEFSLNPGPFDMREYALVSIFANTGAVYGGVTSSSILYALSSS